MSATRRERLPVAVLGATGAVGQTFVRLLDNHPFFQLAEVAASDRSAGRAYADAATWREGSLPHEVARMEVRSCDPDSVRSRIVFSALDASVAGEAEAAFARSGAVVLSNAKSFRMDSDVPLVIPEVNADHLKLIHLQRARRGWSGAIVTNANCSTTVAVLALAPLHEEYGVRTVMATTLQAVSGAGYPGVASLDILGNVIPLIEGEEEKIQTELCKLLGEVGDEGAVPADVRVSAHANRVPVEHGHTICMSVGLGRAASADQVTEVLRGWRGREVCVGLPSAPARPVVVVDEANRPQPRRDVDEGGGMSVLVGRIRPDPVFDVRLVALGHNTIRGAAGGSILNAEVMGRMGLLPDVSAGAW